MSVTSPVASIAAEDGPRACPPLLAHEEYLTEEAFLADRRALIERCWLFAGLADDLKAEGSVALAGIEIALRQDGAAWQARREDRPVAVESCGNLVFVSLAARPEPLERYLHPFAPALHALSSRLGASDRRGNRPIEADWKILVENALDDYHAATVHAQTLYPSMLQGGRRLTQLERHGAHSLWRNELNEEDRRFWEKVRSRLDLVPYAEESDYRHLFIFPNFYAASFCGTMVMLHRVEPVAPRRARLDWSLCLPRSSAHAALRRALVADLARQAERVMEEDAAMCEATQKGHGFAVHPGLLGGREQRIRDFQSALLAARP